MWIWAIKQGSLIRAGAIKGSGYSGFEACKNDPLCTHIPNLGPVPSGAWFIGPEIESEEHGPVAMHLIPLSGTETFGRSAFMIHGDSKEHPGKASHGCIILPRPVREEISAGRDKLLVVVPDMDLLARAA